MMPPRCPICGLSIRNLPAELENKPLSEVFELVEFKDYAPLPNGMSGHPQGMEWFCVEHAKAARTLRHLDSAAAIDALVDDQ